MYLKKTPSLVQNMGSSYLWRLQGGDSEKSIALTFDDGPVPEITEWVLDLLSSRQITATFFCVGENVEKHPSIFERLVEEGHAYGNHTYNHLNAWKCSQDEYLDNVQKCQDVLPATNEVPMFRPPYGRITPGLAKKLRAHYRLVMWDVLSGDFDSTLTAESCLENTVSHTESGSIIVFHDNPKTWQMLQDVLPSYIDVMIESGYHFKAITPDK